VNDANRFYQVAYGMSRPDELEHVSISVGFLVESYINFGWAGVVPVLFLIGVIIGILERTLLSPQAGVLFNGVGIAMALNLMGVEAQAAQYLGGLAQPLLLTAVVFAPFLQFRKSERMVPASA
jgi:hypothetical protein